MRSALHYNWARFQNLFLFSPTDAIQTYFGEEVGLYFAFITVYTIGRPNPTQTQSNQPIFSSCSFLGGWNLVHRLWCPNLARGKRNGLRQRIM